jgi:hypothetical protein
VEEIALQVCTSGKGQSGINEKLFIGYSCRIGYDDVIHSFSFVSKHKSMICSCCLHEDKHFHSFSFVSKHKSMVCSCCLHEDKHFGVLFKQNEVQSTMTKVTASCDENTMPESLLSSLVYDT